MRSVQHSCMRHGCDAAGSGRGERIRTSGLYVPNVALYQAKLHPDLRPQPMRSHGVERAHEERSTDRTQNSSRASRALEWRQHAQAAARLVGLGARRVARGVERAGAAHDLDDLAAAVRPRRARWRGGSGRARLAVPRSIAISSGSVGLPSRRSSPTFLPSCCGVAFVVEQVVDQLERRAQRAAVVGAGFFDVAGRRSASTAPRRALASNSLAVLKRITRR